ncbi:MAG: hypothetical protein C5B58_13680 [Acidobacteria bacterium]|nr:MAG: hypothetical protein C5B58_13680 [Acidobacteriota bacterium]
MPVYKGSYSHDFDESKVTGLDDNAYYSSRTPGKFTAKQTPTSVKVDENMYDSIGTEGEGLKGGFSSWVSRNRK